ncbi:MAG TPA: 50S ribosomal protein L23 [Candidatus Paceibacterota bacterium]
MLRRPHITEKSSTLGAQNVYSFVVSKTATKSTVAKDVIKEYKVTVLSVRMVTLPSKRKVRGAKVGRSGGIKKAYVKLNKGDKIEFV